MAEYQGVTGETVLIWARIDPRDTPRFVRAKIYRPSGALLSTLDLTLVSNGYYEDRSLLYNSDDYWTVELEVFFDAAYTQRDGNYYQTDYIYKAQASSGSQSSISSDGAIIVDIFDEDTIIVDLYQEIFEVDLSDSDVIEIEFEKSNEIMIDVFDDESINVDIDC